MRTQWPPLCISAFSILIFLSQYICDDEPSCFQVTSLNCSEASKTNEKCKKIESDASSAQMFCCNITSEAEILQFINKLKTNGRSILGFHLRDSNISRLSMNTLNNLPDLVSLSITETNLSKWEGYFERHPALSCLNISQNIYFGSNIPLQFVAKLRSLKNFAISHNNITEIPDLPSSISGLFRLDVSGNRYLTCGTLVNLTSEIEKKSRSLIFVNKNSTVCLPPDKAQFEASSPIRIQLLDIERDIRTTFQRCPIVNMTKCECSVFSLDSYADESGNRLYKYYSFVNCSSRGITSLPIPLPPNTRVLDVTNNSITSLEGIGNETFNNLPELYADDNHITTLKHLEGTTFLENFQNLTLKNNKIDQIQEYLFSNVFERDFGRSLLLAKNYFKCDCHTASQTKLWLTANKIHVHDYDQIYANCESPMKVLDLDPKDLCSKPTNWKDYIRYLIALEISLFVLLIGKVSYDYYVFKTAGYLPWPASKMPKLPCDWCFES